MLTFAIKKKRTPFIATKRRTPTVSPMTHSLRIQQAKVRHILRSPTLQPKLTIDQPNDKYEQEADWVANEVMRMPEPRLQRQVEPEEEEEEEPIQAKMGDGAQVQRQEEELEEEPIQTKQVSTHTPEVTPNLAFRIQSLKGGGHPLPQSVRMFFEPRFGYDFSHVRMHTDAEAAGTARVVNARAFTNTRNIVFGSGQYVPGTIPGKKLLAHELTHVVQQSIQGNDSETVQRQPYSYIRLLELGKRLVTAVTNPLIDKAIGRFAVKKCDPRKGCKPNYFTPPEWFWSPNKKLEPSLDPDPKQNQKNRKGKTVMQKLKEWGIPIMSGEVIVNKGWDLIYAFNHNYNLSKLKTYRPKKKPSHCNDFVYDSIYGINTNIPLSGHKHYWGPKRSSRVSSILQKFRGQVKSGDVMFQPDNGSNGHMEIVLFTQGQYINTIGNQGIKRRLRSTSRWSKMIFRRLR